MENKNKSFNTFMTIEELPESTKALLNEYEEEYEWPGFWDCSVEEVRKEENQEGTEDEYKLSIWHIIDNQTGRSLDEEVICDLSNRDYSHLQFFEKLSAQCILGKIWNGKNTGCFSISLACSSACHRNKNAFDVLDRVNKFLEDVALDMGYEIQININHDNSFYYQIKTDEEMWSY